MVKRPGRALFWLFSYKVACHAVLLSLYGGRYYVAAYGVYIGGLAILICWTLCSIAYFDGSGVYYCLLFSVLGSVLSIYASPQAPLVTMLLQAYSRLCWLAPASLLLWGILDPPPQVSRRTTFLYLGFVVLICWELLASFSMLAGLHRATRSYLYPFCCIIWIIALMQREPDWSIENPKMFLRKVTRTSVNLQQSTILSGLRKGNMRAYPVANQKRRVS
jgi:hypothetical protein